MKTKQTITKTALRTLWSSLLVIFLGTLLAGQALAQQITPDEAKRIELSQAYGKLPLSFEANQGQTDPQVKFLSRGNGYSLFLTPTEAGLVLKKTARANNAHPGVLPSRAIKDERSAQAPTLTSSAFYGGAGDQRGTAIAISDGIYISGNVQPESQSPSDTALVLKYALPSGPSPVWARSYGFGTDFFGIAATDEGVYADGWNYSLTTDNVGGKEVKTFLAKFANDGTSGPGPGGAIWATGGPGNLGTLFAYSGFEAFQAATTAVESGSPVTYAVGGGQPCSFFAYLIAKYDASGNFLAKATDPGQEPAFDSCFYNGIASNGSGVAVLNGNIYAVGGRGGFPTIWKHAPDLSVVWRQQGLASGSFQGVSAMGNAIYAVGNTTTGVVGSEDYLIQKYDEAGNLLWSETSGGANTDVLNGVVAIGTRLFAVGYTESSGAGGADSVVLEIDPATGATLSTTLFGGALDDKANGAATDGTDLYVVGESRSFASAQGNTVGENDVMLLRYNIGDGGGDLTLTSAASRKKHGDAGTFDIDLPLTGTPGVECRVGNGGTFLQTIVFTFSEAVTSVSGTTTTTCGTVNSTTISGSTVTVELGHVTCDGSDITVTVPGVNGASNSVDASATMTLRTGDVNADGVVSTADLKEIRMNVGRGLVNGDNFRDDITVDGKVNHGDTTLEKSKL